MSDAVFARPANSVELTLAAAVAAGKIVQLPEGRAGVYGGTFGSNGGVQGETVALRTDGQYTVTKRTGEVWLDGDPLWWDHSALVATCLEPIGSSDRDFFIGVSVGDAASDDASGTCNLNVEPAWIIDTNRDNGDTVLVKTAGAPYLFNRGGVLAGGFDTTAEVQKFDWLSDRGFAVGSNWVAEILLEVATAPDNAAVDVDVGVASATHASDFEAIAEFAAFHLDGDNQDLDAHSDDGTTDVAPTDTTVNWTTGTPLRLKLDGRNPSDVKFYAEGVEQLSGTANLGNLAAAVGPLKAIVHAEKTADDSPLELKARVRVRTCQQNTLGTL